jgi:predicted nucleic acid-binding OB-fold protein
MSKKLWALWASELYTEKPTESVKDKLWALWSTKLNGQPQESIVETTTVLKPALGEEVEVAEMAEVLDLAVHPDSSQNHLVSHQDLATVGKLELPALVNSIISGQMQMVCMKPTR